jgi:hypothetical protein
MTSHDYGHIGIREKNGSAADGLSRRSNACIIDENGSASPGVRLWKKSE